MCTSLELSISIYVISTENKCLLHDCHNDSGYCTWDPRNNHKWCKCKYGYGGRNCETRKNILCLL